MLLPYWTLLLEAKALSYSSFYPHLVQCLAHSKHLVNRERVKEWRQQCDSPADALCIHHTPSPKWHVSRMLVLSPGQFCSQRHFTMSGDILVVTVGCGGSVSLGSSGHRPGMLLNILQCPGQPPTTKTYPAETVVRAKVEKSWSWTGSGAWKTQYRIPNPGSLVALVVEMTIMLDIHHVIVQYSVLIYWAVLHGINSFYSIRSKGLQFYFCSCILN